MFTFGFSPEFFAMLITCSPMIKTWRLHQPATSREFLRRKNLVGGAHWSTHAFLMGARGPVRTSPRKRTARGRGRGARPQMPDPSEDGVPAAPGDQNSDAPPPKRAREKQMAPKIKGIAHWSSVETDVRCTALPSRSSVYSRVAASVRRLRWAHTQPPNAMM